MAKSKAHTKAQNRIAMERTKNYRRLPDDRKNPLELGHCGAKRHSDGKPCRLVAGFGTDHKGIGVCKYHGGMTPNSRLGAQRKKAILMGAPKEINPVDALYWCIKITAGEVEWLSDSIALLDKKEWIEDSILGKQMHLFVRERKEAVERLANYSKMAISLGLAERAVRLAENYGVALSKLLGGVLDDLQLSPEQQKLAPLVVRKHLVLLEGGNPISTREKKALKALEAGEDWKTGQPIVEGVSS